MDKSKMKRWTEDDLIYLEYFLYSSDESIYKAAEEILKRDSKSIAEKACEIRKYDNNVGYLHKPYTDREILYIKRMYPTQTLIEIGEALGRSQFSIHQKIISLGIKKNKRLHEYDSEIRRLASEGCYKSEIARRLGIKPHSLHYYLERHGIKCKSAPRNANQKHFRDLNEIRYNQMNERRGSNVRTKRNQ